jgi:uncharacterized protein (TIGR02594 family)
MLLLNNDPMLIAFAALDLGKTERNNDAPWLRTMLGRLGLGWLIGQPWCGSIMADWAIKAGHKPPKAAYRAQSWLDWGQSIAEPVRGCVVVFERRGGGHVGIVVGHTATGQLAVLSGNVGDKVCVASFKRERVLGYRLPPGDRQYAALPLVEADGSPGEA